MGAADLHHRGCPITRRVTAGRIGFPLVRNDPSIDDHRRPAASKRDVIERLDRAVGAAVPDQVDPPMDDGDLIPSDHDDRMSKHLIADDAVHFCHMIAIEQVGQAQGDTGRDRENRRHSRRGQRLGITGGQVVGKGEPDRSFVFGTVT